MADLCDSCIFGKISLARAREQLERGADVNYVQSNSTCLMSAVRSKNIELVSLLLEQPGIDVNAKDRFGRTVLHRAAGTVGTPAILRLLLDFPGIDREAKDLRNWTPLVSSIYLATVAQFAEFLKTPEVLLNDDCIPNHPIRNPVKQKMFAEER